MFCTDTVVTAVTESRWQSLLVCSWLGRGLEDSSQNEYVSAVWKQLMARKIWFLKRNLSALYFSTDHIRLVTVCTVLTLFTDAASSWVGIEDIGLIGGGTSGTSRSSPSSGWPPLSRARLWRPEGGRRPMTSGSGSSASDCEFEGLFPIPETSTDAWPNWKLCVHYYLFTLNLMLRGLMSTRYNEWFPCK